MPTWNTCGSASSTARQPGDEILGGKKPPALAQMQPKPSVDLLAQLRELGRARRRSRERRTRGTRSASAAVARSWADRPASTTRKRPTRDTSRQQFRNEFSVCSVALAVRPGDQADDHLGLAWTGEQALHQRIRVGRRRLDHRRHADVAVARNPLPIIVGDVGSGQQAPPQRERLGMLADPGCAHRLLIDCAPGIDVCADKHDVLFGKRDFGGALGEQVAELVALLVAVLTGDVIQRFGAGRSKLPGPQVGVLNIWPRRTELRHRHPRPGTSRSRPPRPSHPSRPAAHTTCAR